VKRSEATRRVEALLGRLVDGEARALPRVREVWVFGSFARGALEVGDIDVAVEFDQTKDEAGRWFATLMAGGYDHLGALRRELRGNQRALERSTSTSLRICARRASSHACCGGAPTHSR
jgi:predicted nucleotidyltransferase